MKIKSRVFVITILPIMLGAGILFGQYWMNSQVEKSLSVAKLTDEINGDVAAITYLMGEFVLHPGSARVQQQLSNKLISLDGKLVQLSFVVIPAPEAEARITKVFNRIKNDYQRVISIHPADAGIAPKLVSLRHQRLVENILLHTQIMMTESLKLNKTTRNLLISSQQRSTQIMYVVVVLSVVVLAFLAFAMGRRIIMPLARLKYSTNVVGSGDLDHRIGDLGNDEFGEVSRAFDTMVIQLKRTLASRDELDKEVSIRKKTEEILRKKEHRLAEAQRIAQLGSWEWDIANAQLEWSDEVYRIFGLAPNQFENTYEGFLATIHDDDREAVIHAVDKAISDPANEYYIEHRIVLPGGCERTVLEQGEVTFDSQGTAVFMMGTVLDVTERKQIELQQLQTVERRSSQQQAMIEVTHKYLMAGDDLEQILSCIVEKTARTLGASRVSIWLFDPVHEFIHCIELYEKKQFHQWWWYETLCY